MKKFLTPCLCIVAIAAIVLCFVFNGQKNDANTKLNDITAKLTDMTGQKDAAEAAKTELETKVNDLTAQLTDMTGLKDAAEAAKAELETKVTEMEAQMKQLTEEAAAAVQSAAGEVAEQAADASAEAAAAVTEAATEAAQEPAEEGAVMTHADFVAAELDSEVTVETYVQATQSWWEDKITVYAQSEDGAYFIYNMNCSEEDAAKLVPGTKIRVKGFKSEWSGEVEITDAAFEILEGDAFIAEPEDVTAKLGKEELINCQNELVAFKGMTVEAYDETGAAFAYKNAENKTDDLYFKVSKDGQTYDFCVEFYLCGQDTEVYKAVEGLKVGDVIDLEGFLYWYNGANPHIIKVTPAA